MDYETIGGETKNTNDVVELRNLSVGDKFSMKSSKHIFEVTGEKCVFSRIGTSTRLCFNKNTGVFEWKKCNTKVYKI